MNYGYAPLDKQAAPLHLLPEDKANCYFIQLYYHVASGVDVAGLDVIDNERKLALIQRYFPKWLLRSFQDFAAVWIYERNRLSR